MPFNASGVFQRLFNWRSDRDAGIKILADRMDQEFDNVAGGLNDIAAGDVSFRGPLTGGNGTRLEPAFSFADDPDTGVFRPDPDTLAIAAGGVVAMKADSTGVTVAADPPGAGHLTRKAYVDAEIAAAINALIDGAPGALNTLRELAAAIQGNDADIAGLGDQIATRLPASSYTAADVLAKIRTVDGPGSGLNADLFDNLGSYQFLRADADDTMWASLTVAGNVSARGDLYVGENGGGDSRAFFRDDNSNTWRTFYWDDSTSEWRCEAQNGTNYRIWHAGNDGPGSGLNADLLDGQHLSALVRKTGFADELADIGAFTVGTYQIARYTGAAEKTPGDIMPGSSFRTSGISGSGTGNALAGSWRFHSRAVQNDRALIQKVA